MPFHRPELRAEPERCNAPRVTGVRHDRKNCAQCVAWDRFTRLRRWDMIQAGTYVSNRYHADITPAHRCKRHGRHMKGCQACRDWNRYQAALRRQRIQTGQYQPAAPIGQVKAHMDTLLDPKTGGWFISEIVSVTGLSLKTVQELAAGGRKVKVFAATWDAVRVLQPKGTPRPRTAVMVDATEVRRTFQGLAAQGFTFDHLAALMGLSSKNSANRLASHPSPWTTPDSVQTARKLRRKLGDHDVTRELLPGMSKKCATLARRRGWLPLNAWAGRDIADPAARPRSLQLVPSADEGDALPALPPFVDPVLATFVRLTAERLADTTRDLNRRADGYIKPTGRITRLEMHAVVSLGLRSGMTQSQVAALIGYPSSTPEEIERAQRSVGRFKRDITAAEKWIQEHPVGWLPSWFTFTHTAGVDDFGAQLPALLALQPAPFGPGWDLTELAERCGVSPDEMQRFIDRAAGAADKIWQPRRCNTSEGQLAA